MKTPLTRTGIVDILRDQRPELRRFGVDTIALFGSYAKEAQTSSSDLDFLVKLFRRDADPRIVGRTVETLAR